MISFIRRLLNWVSAEPKRLSTFWIDLLPEEGGESTRIVIDARCVNIAYIQHQENDHEQLAVVIEAVHRPRANLSIRVPNVEAGMNLIDRIMGIKEEYT